MTKYFYDKIKRFYYDIIANKNYILKKLIIYYSQAFITHEIYKHFIQRNFYIILYYIIYINFILYNNKKLFLFLLHLDFYKRRITLSENILILCSDRRIRLCAETLWEILLINRHVFRTSNHFIVHSSFRSISFVANLWRAFDKHPAYIHQN